MGLTTTKSEGFSVCANRSQSHMCRATARAPVSLSPALRAPLPDGKGLTIREWRQAAGMQDRCAGRNYPLPDGQGGRGDREIHEQAAIGHI